MNRNPALCGFGASVAQWIGLGATAVLFTGIVSAEDLVYARKITLWSESLDEARTLLIAPPDDYEENRAACPVLFLLDGDRNMQHATAAVRFLEQNGHIPRLLVVGIPNVDRARDLTPAAGGGADSDAKGRNYGRGDAFLKFLTGELTPWLDEHYRTAPFRILVGHSRGGLFAFHTLCHAPDAFEAYLAISPALWWNQREALTGLEEELGALPRHRRLFFSASHEAESITSTARELEERLTKVTAPNLGWTFRFYGNDTHGSTIHRGLYDGLEAIFSGFRIPEAVILADGITGIETHYRTQEAAYGFAIKPPFGMLDWAGYFLLQQKKPEAAVAVFQRNIEFYPHEPGAYASLAAALQEAGRGAEAARAMSDAYHRAVDW